MLSNRPGAARIGANATGLGELNIPIHFSNHEIGSLKVKLVGFSGIYIVSAFYGFLMFSNEVLFEFVSSPEPKAHKVSL